MAVAVERGAAERVAAEDPGADSAHATQAAAATAVALEPRFSLRHSPPTGNCCPGGVWEVIWSLYMVARGGDLTWIGLTFAISAC